MKTYKSPYKIKRQAIMGFYQRDGLILYILDSLLFGLVVINVETRGMGLYPLVSLIILLEEMKLNMTQMNWWIL
jgi:hypothetical protein